MNNIELSASMMCADFSCLRDEVKKLEKAGIDVFHIDIMDGSFVDNFGMGYQDMAYIKNNSSKKAEVHLMVKQPYNYLNILFKLKIDIIYIHPEVDTDPATTIEKIQQQGAVAGIAINPGTSVSTIEELLNIVDSVLVLGVNPGHSGRQYQPYVDNKIKKLLLLREKYNFTIALDGAVTKERLLFWHKKGVSKFVLGTATLFNKDSNKSYNAIIRNIKQDIK